jgi:hypothetical protein
VKYPFLSLVAGVSIVALVACRAGVHPAAAQAPAAGVPSAGSPHGHFAGVGTGTSTAGKVVETMNAGGYTYVQVDDGTKKIWAAAPQFVVAVGDRVIVPEGVPMTDFHSKTLDRTFDVVYFVPAVQVLGSHSAKEQIAAAHSAAGQGATAVDLSNIAKPPGGYTVAELFADKAALAGKEVVVRGRVVKSTPEVMGKNWLHVRDGTGNAGTNDLTVTTSALADVGKTVLVRGKLSTDKDFGAGYRYDIIIEDATVAVE